VAAEFFASASLWIKASAAAASSDDPTYCIGALLAALPSKGICDHLERDPANSKAPSLF
jgi:hypothetical protein